jgi:plasmid stabilization system protein ParE
MHEAQLAAQSLKKFPQRGRIVPELRDASVREIFVKQYRLIYEVRSNGIVILSFLHGARQFPETI